MSNEFSRLKNRGPNPKKVQVVLKKDKETRVPEAPLPTMFPEIFVPEFINEVFDKHYSFNKVPTKEYDHRYDFTTDSGNDYSVNINHFNHGGTHGAYLNFDRRNDETEDPNGKDFGLLGDENNNSHKVIGTVNHIIKQHLKKNPSIKTMNFSSREPSRTKLYNRVLKKSGRKFKIEDDGDQTNFRVDIS